MQVMQYRRAKGSGAANCMGTKGRKKRKPGKMVCFSANWKVDMQTAMLLLSYARAVVEMRGNTVKLEVQNARVEVH